MVSLLSWMLIGWPLNQQRGQGVSDSRLCAERGWGGNRFWTDLDAHLSESSALVDSVLVAAGGLSEAGLAKVEKG
jgi:hypothetical protein